MKFTRWSVVTLVSLVVFVGHPSLAQPGGPTLSAEGYRDLVLSTADPLSHMSAYANVTDGTGTQYIDGRQRSCIMTITVTEETMAGVAVKTKTWKAARPPKGLESTHKQVLKWMEDMRASAKTVPSCFEPLLQASEEQYGFLVGLGGYDELRGTIATKLAEMGTELPALPKPKN